MSHIFAPIYRAKAKLIPQSIRRAILDENFIQTAVNVPEPGSVMEYLFDVFMEYVDKTGEHDDFTCYQCRQAVLNEWRELEPYLKELP